MVVDDHPLLRQGVAQLVDAQDDLESCEEVVDSASVLQRVAADDPDVVVMDLSLEETDGLDIIKQLKAQRPDQAILVYSMHDERLYAERALQAGALGFVNKQEPPEALIEAIRRTLSGRIHLSDGMSDRLLQRAAKGAPEEASEPVLSLSDRELQVLRLIGQGLTTRKVAARLRLSVKTVDTYRENLKAKLNLETSNELIRFAALWVAEHDGP